MRILAVESSCDETAMAVVEDGRRVLSQAIASQINIHALYGGVVPEIASREHVLALDPLLDQVLPQGETVDAVAVTFGPGLVGALLTGVSWAKGFAYARGLPLIPVNHIEGHVSANYIAHPSLEPPFVCLVASGGHSHIVRVDDYCTFALLGRTRDDAAGEAFDKVARVLGLGYPGGPALEALAREGDPHAFSFHAGFNDKPTFDFSFSGLKTAVINLVHTAQQRGETLCAADVAASFQHAVVETLAEKSMRAAVESGTGTLALAGGVSANRALRSAMQRRAEEAGLRFCCPEFRFCTDNAAMIACAGYYALMAGQLSPLSLNAVPSLALAPEPEVSAR